MRVVIYRIKCRDETIVPTYIGATSTSLGVRTSTHKYNCSHETSRAYNTPLYRFIRENGGWCNWMVEMLAERECADKFAKLEFEREYYDLYQPELNIERPAEHMRLGHKAYRERYREEHREENKAACKSRYERCRVDVLKTLAERVVCDRCGTEVRRGYLKRHQNTKVCAHPKQ
jgi:hypothetical protein